MGLEAQEKPLRCPRTNLKCKPFFPTVRPPKPFDVRLNTLQIIVSSTGIRIAQIALEPAKIVFQPVLDEPRPKIRGLFHQLIGTPKNAPMNFPFSPENFHGLIEFRVQNRELLDIIIRRQLPQQVRRGERKTRLILSSSL